MKKFKKQEKAKVVELKEVTKEEIIKEEIIEITDKVKVAELEKQGYTVTEIKSEIKGERPKTWILRKGAI